ncbi:MAG TPA: radical SAM protein [Elusimicrobiota bacterium]|nr:radical SAM protein [Elusimicrobiota bacterium]
MTRSDVVLVDICGAQKYPSLAIGCLTAWARKDGALGSLGIAGLTSQVRESRSALVESICALEPSLVGFSCYIWNFRQVLETVERLKARSPKVRVVLGGPQVASVAGEVLERWGSVDFAALGEGEETFRQLLGSLFLDERPLGMVEGLAFRDGGKIVSTHQAALIDLGDLPSPYLDRVIDLDSFKYDFATIDSSRGCPFTCKFCDWGPRNMRYASIERLEAEFRFLAPRVKFVALTAADLLMNKKAGVAVMESFLRATDGLECRLGFDTNPTFIIPEIVDVAARAPEKFYFACGLQSTDEEVLAKNNRVFDRARVEANIADLRRRAPGVGMKFSAIFGLPGDDFQGWRQTVDWAYARRPDAITCNHALVLPGAEFRREAESLGLRYQADPPHQVLSTDWMSPSDLKASRRLGFHTELSLSLVFVKDRLLETAEGLKDESLPYVRVVEAWAARLRKKGVDLTFGRPIDDIDGRLLSERILEAYEDIVADPILLGVIDVLTRDFAAEIKANGLSPSSASTI